VRQAVVCEVKSIVTLCSIHSQYSISENDLLTSVESVLLAAAKRITSHAGLSGPVYKGITKILYVLGGISKQEQCRGTLLQIK